MVKKQQKKKVIAKKVVVAKKVQKKVPKVKKSIKKRPEKKAPVKKTSVKKQKVVVKKATRKAVKKSVKNIKAKPVKKQVKKPVKKPTKEKPEIRPKIKAEKKPNTIYTADQIQTFQKAKKDLQNKSNKQLAEMLQANNQTKSGTKDNLIERIADGITLGQIPRCPVCFGGRLRFNRLNGEYTCPGYQDDDKFRFCNKKFGFWTIIRSPWVEADS